MTIDYLRRYTRQPAPENSQSPAAHPAGRDAQDIGALLGAASVQTSRGPCSVVEHEWPLDYRHGLHTVGSFAQAGAAHFALLCNDRDLEYADLRKALFLDTETTGLSMGAGTYVFLVGAGYIDGDRFRMRQFFMSSPGDEGAFLEALFDFLGQFSVLVTFNGKAFDWPLIENRFVRHRAFRAAPLSNPPHLDLLHPARRLWKRRLENCRLVSLEREILGVTRTGDDVPGWIIPSLYFQYLRSGDARPLEGIFYHNLVDILSLAGLASHMDAVVDDPFNGLVQHPQDFLPLGKTFDRVGDAELAILCFEQALRGDLEHEHREEGLIGLASVLKRERRWDGCHSAWERLIEAGGAGSHFALVERAKYYEHVERDHLAALDDVRAALAVAHLDGGALSEDARAELEHRQSRLLNRVLKERSWAR